MIIFLYGEDSFRRNKKVRELTDAYKEKHPSIDMAVYDLDESPEDWGKARDFLVQPSMFADAKLLVIKEVQSVGEKEWIKTLKRQAETEKTFVIISDGKSPKKDFGFLKKSPVKIQEFAELESVSLSAFFVKEAGLRGLEFSNDAKSFLLAYVGDSKERSALLVNELEKIYLGGFGRVISKQDLDGLVKFEKREAVWRAGSAMLRERNVFRRLGLLEKILFQREAPSYIFNSLGFQASGKTALKLAEYDVSVKSGGLEYEEALTDFALLS